MIFFNFLYKFPLCNVVAYMPCGWHDFFLFFTILLQETTNLQLSCPKVSLLNINKIVLNIPFEYILKFFTNEVKNVLISQYPTWDIQRFPKISDNTLDCHTWF